MRKVSRRLERRVRADFGTDADAVLGLLARVPDEVPGATKQDAERLQAALVLPAHGDVHHVAQALVTAMTDWRDLLVGSGLAGADWRDVLAERIGRR